MADGSVSIRTPPEKGYGLTLDCDLSKIQDEAQAALFCSKIASVRALVQVRLPTQTNEPSARLPSRDQESDASFSLSLSLSLSRSVTPAISLERKGNTLAQDPHRPAAGQVRGEEG